jgi:threonine dehydrogenase-like Zn-dependent dehydrogenase
VKPGDHVITCLSAFCGHCEFCLTGHMRLCVSPETKRGQEDEPRLASKSGPMMQYLNLSSFAEQMLIHEHACVAIRKDMPLDRAALIGCGVTTGVGAVIHTAKVPPGATVAVLGCGGVGLACINGAAIAGAGRIIAIDAVNSKLDLARKFGATDVINAKEKDAVNEVIEMKPNNITSFPSSSTNRIPRSRKFTSVQSRRVKRLYRNFTVRCGVYTYQAIVGTAAIARIGPMSTPEQNHCFVTLNVGDADVKFTRPGVQRATKLYLKTYENSSLRQPGEL